MGMLGVGISYDTRVVPVVQVLAGCLNCEHPNQAISGKSRTFGVTMGSFLFMTLYK